MRMCSERKALMRRRTTRVVVVLLRLLLLLLLSASTTLDSSVRLAPVVSHGLNLCWSFVCPFSVL